MDTQKHINAINELIGAVEFDLRQADNRSQERQADLYVVKRQAKALGEELVYWQRVLDGLEGY